MTNSDYRTVLSTIKTDLATNWPVGYTAPQWQFSEPVAMLADVPRCALWFAGESVDPSGPTGARNYIETYRLRYWEPATLDAQNMWVDETAANAVEVLYGAVRDRFMVNANTLTTNGPWKIWPQAGQVLVGGNQELGYLRGFELQWRADRFRNFT